MKVIHFGLSTNKGGIENSLVKVARAIDREKYSFSYIDIHSGGAAFRQELTSLGCEFFDIPSRRDGFRRNRAALSRLFKENQFDVLHFHANTLSYIAPILYALANGVKVIVHSRSSSAPSSAVTWSSHFLNSLLMPWTRVYRVAVSHQAGQWLFGRRMAFDIIHNGVNLERFRYRPTGRAEMRKQLGLASSFVIGHVGVFLPVKNQEFLLDVLKYVLKHVPNAFLVLVGDGPTRATVAKSAAKKGIASRVVFLGVRDDVPDLLSVFDCFAFPSKYEGFPNAVLEAQASDLPTIVSEAVSPEAIVSSDCIQLSLKSGSVAWGEQIVCLAGRRRARSNGVVLADGTGWSVEEEVRAVGELYDRVVQPYG